MAAQPLRGGAVAAPPPPGWGPGRSLPPAMAAKAGPEGEQPPPAWHPRLSGGAVARAAGAMLQFLVRLRALRPGDAAMVRQGRGRARRGRCQTEGGRAQCPATPRPRVCVRVRPPCGPVSVSGHPAGPVSARCWILGSASLLGSFLLGRLPFSRSFPPVPLVLRRTVP